MGNLGDLSASAICFISRVLARASVAEAKWKATGSLRANKLSEENVREDFYKIARRWGWGYI